MPWPYCPSFPRISTSDSIRTAVGELPASVIRMDGPTIDSEFLWPLVVMAVAFTLLFFTLHLMAIRNEIWRRRIAVMRRHAARAAQAGD